MSFDKRIMWSDNLKVIILIYFKDNMCNDGEYYKCNDDTDDDRKYNIEEEKSTTCWPNSEEKLNEKPAKCENFQIVKREYNLVVIVTMVMLVLVVMMVMTCSCSACVVVNTVSSTEERVSRPLNIRNIIFNVIIIIIIFMNKVLLGVLTGDLGLGQRKKGEMWIYIEIYICLMFFISRDLRAW